MAGGPGVKEWNAQKELLEAELARQMPEMNVEQKLRVADRQAVALALPEGAALVEFVRFNIFDFKAIPARGESQRKPTRYLAFVVRAGEPDNVHMIDLGEAEPIDQMIATFRAGITGESESRSAQVLGADSGTAQVASTQDGVDVRMALFDPLRFALGGRKRLLLAPDGDLSRLPFEVLPASDGRRLIDEYRISYLGAGRDLLRFGAGRSGQPTDPLVVADPDFDLGEKAVAAAHAAAGVLPDASASQSKAGFWSRLLGRGEAVPASPTRSAAEPAPGGPMWRQSRDFDSRTLHFERLRGTRGRRRAHCRHAGCAGMTRTNGPGGAAQGLPVAAHRALGYAWLLPG